MKQDKHPRKLSNFIINPIFQSRMALRFIFAYLIVSGGLQIYFIYQINSYVKNFTKIFPVSTDQHLVLHDIVTNVIFAMGTITILGALTIFGISIVYSHKIAGPIYVIKQNIQKMIQGDLSVRSHFREGDEFNEIAHELGILADKLKSKN